MFNIIWKSYDGMHEATVEDFGTREQRSLIHILLGLEHQGYEYKVSSRGHFLRAEDFNMDGARYWLEGDTPFS